MPKLIVADENEGRRGLLANTLERAGYDVTRAGTLRQAEGTALATMPEVVLFDGEWNSGDPIDSAQRLMADPEFAFKCRIVILSRNNSQDYLVSAARAGINEVITKPVDMNMLLSQLEKHSLKQFVPPPANVASPINAQRTGTFDVSMVTDGGKWALPVLKDLVTPEKISIEFVNEILGQLGEEGIEVDEGIDPNLMSNMLRLALNSIVGDVDNAKPQSNDSGLAASNLPTKNKSNTLGSGLGPKSKKGASSMEEILQNQVDALTEEIEGKMDDILDESPEYISILEDREKTVIDPAVLKFTKLVAESAHELMWDLGRPGNVTDITLLTRIEDITEMLGDVVSSLPDGEEE